MTIKAIIPNSVHANLEGIVPNYLESTVQGLVSRGVKAVEVDNAGCLIFTLTDNTQINLGVISGSGTHFQTDDTLTLEDGVLSVNTADAVEADNTLPITSAAVYSTVGNIEAVLATI